MKPFTYQTMQARVRFDVDAATAVCEEVKDRRTLVLSTPFQASDAQALAKGLGARCAGLFTEAAMHTPVDVTERAVALFDELSADCVVAFGGGSATGLGKAIAYRRDCLQIAIPTTYAGSEVTPILGQTENGLKTTLRDARVLPDVVLYDPSLTLGLTVSMSVTSGLNAMAHAFEALYARDSNPVASHMALEGIKALQSALPVIAGNPQHREARTQALYGAWLCGTVLGSVGMSLHHKLAHALGGSFNLPHAETHAILLPHTMAYNAGAAELAEAAALFGGDLGSGLYGFAASLDAPLALGGYGFEKADIARAAKLATANPYWNPRPVTEQDIAILLSRAQSGAAPA
ncbi:maleylacetate reductase [Roseibium litorale]|uniref:Maleylacetate reductase n=1 Tax=Roseibium litorale TaxID=2803841 RepID=A0ABR9CSS1_9HYPH|nr:maleylacetate reductase [Roseibium litorale]MBD8893649.1 maleylacetate reductase [Roseibium litorale]